MNEIVVKQIIKIFRISYIAVVLKHLVLILLKPYKVTGCFQGSSLICDAIRDNMFKER